MSQTVEEVCRLCLSKDKLLLPIFGNRLTKNEADFRTKVMSCASVEIFADDDLPSKVCYICIHKVEKFFQFQIMCENSDLILRSQLKENATLNETNYVDNKEGLGQNMESEKFGLEQNCYPSDLHERKTNCDFLTCSICKSIFVTNNLLIDHLMKDHPDVNVFFCKTCKISFSHVNQFKNHLIMQHSLTCSHCNCVFKNEKNLKDHLKIHINENLTCKFCHEAFTSFDEMKNHQVSHSEKTCSYCNKEFNSKDEFELHLNKCDQKHHCKFCKESFKLKKDLIEHVNKHHDPCFIEKFDNVQNEQSFQLNEQNSKSDGEEDKSFLCGLCQIQFSDELSLISHMEADHNATFNCRFCTKQFGLRSSLKRHERSHMGIKPYQCKFCPRKFKDSSACVVHTRTHTGEHPFRCEECQKDFKQLANLKMHTYRHHKKKSSESQTEIVNDNATNFEQLYSGDIIENYSGDNVRAYQCLNETIPNSFNQGINVLISDQQSIK